MPDKYEIFDVSIPYWLGSKLRADWQLEIISTKFCFNPLLVGV